MYLSVMVSSFLMMLVGEGNGTPLQYSCLENPMDGGAWRATVHGIAKSRTQLSDFTYLLTYLLNDAGIKKKKKVTNEVGNFMQLPHVKAFLWPVKGK